MDCLCIPVCRQKIEYAPHIEMSRMPPVRAEKLSMADARAMEEQNEREVDVRGMPQKPLPLSGGRTRKMAPKAEEPHEAEGYGRQLMEHIHKLHGGAYGTAFMKGMGAYGNAHVPSTPVKFSSTVPEKAAAMKGKGRMVGAGVLKIEHGGEEMEGCGPMKSMTGKGRMVGAGVLQLTHGEESASDEEMEGGLLTGRFEGEGKPNKRSARAAIVCKVMKEKGLGMAAASKFVKEHGLYKP